MGQVVMEREPDVLSAQRSPEARRYEAVASGEAEDGFVFRRIRIGILAGVAVTVPFTCGIVAVALLVGDSLALGPVLAGVWGGILGGAFLGGIVAIPDLDSVRAIEHVATISEGIERKLAA